MHFKIKGGNKLYGNVTLHGAKNAVLPLMAMGILTDEDVVIDDCPYISDVDVMCRLLQNLGVNVTRDCRRISVHTRATRTSASEEFCKDMRSSMFMLGALLASRGEVRMALPGGCKIGSRPMDIHLDGLMRMGARVERTQDEIICYAERLKGADIVMKYPSVGATENLLMCASLADGATTIVNCAREPEIISLAQGLRAMGARISGEGTSVIKVEGVDKLSGCKITPIADRIVAGTMLCAVALCGGEVSIDGLGEEYLGALTSVLRSKNCLISGDKNSLRINSDGRTHAVNITTAPYPLFPTDLQPQIFVCAIFADGVSTIRETVFENRFAHAKEFEKIGARVRVFDNTVCKIMGSETSDKPCKMSTCDLRASDLRGGAALMLAGLKLRGETNVYGCEYIDRGYEKIEDVFCSLGGYVLRKSG